MPTIAQIREQNPQYKDLSDSQVADTLYERYYRDMPREDFDAKIGFERTSVAEDVARSTATGLREGIEGLAGMMGDANKMTGIAARWLASRMGASDETADMLGNVARRANPLPFAPSSDEINAVTDKVIGEERVPETTAGEYARTLAQFAPGAAASPGTLARKAVMAAVPSVASETAGQLTEGTPLEPYARLGTALVAGGFASGAGQSSKARDMAKAAAEGAPTREQLRQQTDAAYQALRDAEIRYDPAAFGDAVVKMADGMKKAGLRRSLAKEAFDLVDELADDVAKGSAPDFDDVNALSIQVGGAAREAGQSVAKGETGKGPLSKAFSIIEDVLDAFERRAPITSGKGLTAEQADQMRGEARKLALQNIKARKLEAIKRNAETMAGGEEAGLRNGIRTMMRSKAGMIFKGAEREALLDVANGRKPINALSKFGIDLRNRDGNASVMQGLTAVGSSAAAAQGLGPLGLLAGPALLIAGTIGKTASAGGTARAFDDAAAAVRSGKLRNARDTVNKAKAQKVAEKARLLLSGEGGATTTRANPAAPAEPTSGVR